MIKEISHMNFASFSRPERIRLKRTLYSALDMLTSYPASCRLPCISNVIYFSIRLKFMSKVSHIICNFFKEIYNKISLIRTFLFVKSLEFYIKHQTGKNSAQTQHVFCINFAILFAFLM